MLSPFFKQSRGVGVSEPKRGLPTPRHATLLTPDFRHSSPTPKSTSKCRRVGSSDTGVETPMELCATEDNEMCTIQSLTSLFMLQHHSTSFLSKYEREKRFERERRMDEVE